MSLDSTSPLCHRLPEDILYAIFKELFPQLPRAWPLMRPQHTGTHALDDLLCCRLVCHKLASVASFWAWRRLKLQLKTQVNITEKRIVMPEIVNKKQVEVFQEICQGIAGQKDITCYVRDLELVLDGEVFQDGGDARRKAFESLVKTVSMFNDLRSVAILFTNARKYRPALLIIPTLLWKPSIHTVILSGLDFYLIDLRSPTALNHVKNLYLRCCKTNCVSLPLMPKLEVFGYDGSPRGEKVIDPLPWGTLRELNVESPNLNATMSRPKDFISGFETWNLNLSNNGTSPLVELVFQDPCELDVGMVTRAFGGQPLKKLSIGRVRVMTVDLLLSVVDAFPELDGFSVFASCWEGSKTDFAKILGRLANLRSLDWDYLGEQGQDETDDEAEQIPGPVSEKPFEVREKKRCTTIVKCLRDPCPQLRHVTFSRSGINESDGILLFELFRPEVRDVQDGSSEATVRYLGWEPQRKYLTSFWKLWPYT